MPLVSSIVNVIEILLYPSILWIASYVIQFCDMMLREVMTIPIKVDMVALI